MLKPQTWKQPPDKRVLLVTRGTAVRRCSDRSFSPFGHVGAACTCILAFEQPSSRPPFTNVAEFCNRGLGSILQQCTGHGHRRLRAFAASTTLQIGFSAVHRRELLIRA